MHALASPLTHTPFLSCLYQVPVPGLSRVIHNTQRARLNLRHSSTLAKPWNFSHSQGVSTSALKEDLASEAEKFVRDFECQDSAQPGGLEGQYEQLRSQVLPYMIKWAA